MTGRTLQFRFEELPLVVDAGFEAGEVSGSAEIGYHGDGEWCVRAIALDGAKRLPPPAPANPSPPRPRHSPRRHGSRAGRSPSTRAIRCSCGFSTGSSTPGRNGSATRSPRRSARRGRQGMMSVMITAARCGLAGNGASTNAGANRPSAHRRHRFSTKTSARYRSVDNPRYELLTVPC